ncbi:MAG TPA: gamma carbonic anhydrase family protein [bacterium]|jgi:carbonic anhydrase/acetyltransferase-like protein (isoleucine patch superfamily)|nr:gamma carbonic anhydrase family protein [bacterium]
MIQAYLGKSPRSTGAARVHSTAVLIGDVVLGDGVSVWPQAVLRGDYNSITVGSGTNIQDGAVVHNDHGHPAVIGADCVIGHRAVVHGCVIGDRCLIGIGAIVLNGAVVGDECVIGAGALVPEGKTIAPRSLVLGVPGRVVRPVSEEELERTKAGAEHYRGYAQRELDLMPEAG